MTTPGQLQAARLTEYRDELRTVKASVMTTCRDLVRDLTRDGQELEALRADEAAAYLRAAFASLERLLVAQVGPGRNHHP